MATREQVLAQLRKARLNKYAYFGMGLGCFMLAVLLVILFFTRKHDWGALILAPIGVFFGVIMIYQFKHRSLEVAALEQALEEGAFDADELDEAGPEEGEPARPFVAPPTAHRHLAEGNGDKPDEEDDTDEP